MIANFNELNFFILIEETSEPSRPIFNLGLYFVSIFIDQVAN